MKWSWFLSLIVIAFIGLTITPHNAQAGFDCIVDPSITPAVAVLTTPSPTPLSPRCIDKESGGTYLDLRTCLNNCKTDPRYQLRNFGPFLNFPTIGSIMGLAMNVITLVAGILCGVYMFYGAFQYVQSSGDPKKAETARAYIFYAGLGLIIIVLAYAITRVILNVTNTNTIGF